MRSMYISVTQNTIRYNIGLSIKGREKIDCFHDLMWTTFFSVPVQNVSTFMLSKISTEFQSCTEWNSFYCLAYSQQNAYSRAKNRACFIWIAVLMCFRDRSIPEIHLTTSRPRSCITPSLLWHIQDCLLFSTLSYAKQNLIWLGLNRGAMMSVVYSKVSGLGHVCQQQHKKQNKKRFHCLKNINMRSAELVITPFFQTMFSLFWKENPLICSKTISCENHRQNTLARQLSYCCL